MRERSATDQQSDNVPALSSLSTIVSQCMLDHGGIALPNFRLVRNAAETQRPRSPEPQTPKYR